MKVPIIACEEGREWVDWAQLIYSAIDARPNLDLRMRQKITSMAIGGIGN